MTVTTDQNQVQEQKPSEKELNFRALEAKYQRQLDQERTARIEAEKRAEEASKRQVQHQEEDESTDDPYVDHKRLDRRFSSFEKKMEEKIEKKAEEKARGMIEQSKRDSWIKNNPDFYDVLQNADKFAQKDPDLAESILDMPDTFERQKLVYKNIKALGLHKPEQKQQSIQEKVDANRKSPFYQPSGIGGAPYTQVGDYTPTGQKQAYEKMQALKNQLRI